MSRPLDGLRVLEYAQYVAGPLCGLLLGDLGAEVVKVEPPAGDGYRYVNPVAPGLGRFFLPLNRGKRSIVLDLKTEEGRARSAALLATGDVVLHNYPPARAAAFGLDWESVHARHPALVLGVVTSFGPEGPLAGSPAYDLVAQARSGLLTSHAGPGDRVPVRAGGIPIADLTAGHLLASGVLAALLGARTSGVGDRVEVSLLAAAMAVQVQDLLWLEGEECGEARAARPEDLQARAAEIARDLAMNPYYRCYAASEGYLAVACLNLAQRRAFLALFGLDDPTIDAPDVVPVDEAVLAGKHRVTTEIERRIAQEPATVWLARLAAAGVPASPVLVRETVARDDQVVASELIGEVEQGGLGRVCMLGSPLRLGPEPARSVQAAPALGADTDEVLAELEARSGG
jgi:crotonobetainyl-CoA:carnitine CoA-transferase CaiB-like acyl-CoA transferase